MRSTRVTELMKEKPIQDVADWMGHSPETLLKHYAQIVKEQRAVAARGASVLRLSKDPRKAKQKAKHS